MILEHDFRITIELNISFLFKNVYFLIKIRKSFVRKHIFFFFKFFLVQCFPCRSRISFSISAVCVWLVPRLTWLVGWSVIGIMIVIVHNTRQGHRLDQKNGWNNGHKQQIIRLPVDKFSLFSFWENNKKKRLRKWGWSWPDLSQQEYCFGNLNISMRT